MSTLAQLLPDGVRLENILSSGAAQYLEEQARTHPYHFIIGTSLVLTMLYIVVVKRAYDPAKRGYGARGVSGLSEREKEELIAEWTPDPLVSKSAVISKLVRHEREPNRFVTKSFRAGGRNVLVQIEGDPKEKITFCPMDFLGLGSRPTVQQVAHRTLEEYSLGSCGPRGFYGTTPKHLDLEAAIARFLVTPESITYSDSVATVASAIPAFAKRGDVLLMDSGVNHAVLTGAKLSRSKIVMFRHNMMVDLKRQLECFHAMDMKRNDSLQQRRFIVVEGLYANYGDICPLREVVDLAREYKWRIIVDDSSAFGVLGPRGMGSPEHWGLQTLDIDVLMGSLATTLGAVGGFCVGSRQVVDHQRLSGAGYCFSASAPPFLCATATAALGELTKMPSLVTQLRQRSQTLHAELSKRLVGMCVVSDPLSPIFHVQLAGKPRNSAAVALLPEEAGIAAPLEAAAHAQATLVGLMQSREDDEKVLVAIVDRARDSGILISYSHYQSNEFLAPAPTLRFCVTLNHEEEHLQKLLVVLSDVTRDLLAPSGRRTK